VSKGFRPLAFLQLPTEMPGAGGAFEDAGATALTWYYRMTFLKLLPPHVIDDLRTCFLTYLDAVEPAREYPLDCVGAWLPAGLPAVESASNQCMPAAELPAWALTPGGEDALRTAKSNPSVLVDEITGSVQVWRAGPNGGGSFPLVPLARTVGDEEQALRLRFRLSFLAQDLQEWADRYNIGAPWVLEWAIKAIVRDGNDVWVFDDLLSLGVVRAEWHSLADAVRNAIHGEGEIFASIRMPDLLTETPEQVEARYLEQARDDLKRAEELARERGLRPAKRRRMKGDDARYVRWLVMYYFGGLTQEAVAETVGREGQAVSYGIRRARALLELPLRRAERKPAVVRNRSAKNRPA
jgi:hypothetical protein